MKYSSNFNSGKYGAHLVIKFEGKPIALARPRFGGGRVYTKSDQKDAMEEWRVYFLRCLREHGIKKAPQLPCSVHLEFHYKSASKKEIGSPKTTRADVDNLCKWVLDCGNEILWKDDGLVHSLSSVKLWAEKAQTIISIRW